ncbi:serine hydrolase FSH [Hypomontagnella submonticulosa]|nr:serine hydrolase FSH [Hypomontagnella submonticulosa]
MKVLCLHGDEQNSEIFRSQLGLQDLGIDLSFDFANGPLQCPNSPTKDASAGYRYFDTEDADDIRKATEWLAARLENDGPYDGIISYSQGAALVSSFLLYRQWFDHDLPPLFRFAVFIGGSVPLKVLKDLGVPVSSKAESVVTQAKLQSGQGREPMLPHTKEARRALFNSDDCFGLNLNKIPLELKIRIPTAHIWGENDALFPASVQLAGLCDPYLRKVYVHSGLREVPQEKKDLDELKLLIEWCAQRATWPGQMQL